MTPAQAVAGLKLAKRKKRHKIHPAWRVPSASCKGLLRLGHGQLCGVGSVGSGGGIEMGGKVAGGTTTWEGLSESTFCFMGEWEEEALKIESLCVCGRWKGVKCWPETESTDITSRG